MPVSLKEDLEESALMHNRSMAKEIVTRIATSPYFLPGDFEELKKENDRLVRLVFQFGMGMVKVELPAAEKAKTILSLLDRDEDDPNYQSVLAAIEQGIYDDDD